jgi:hypothetical protein
MEGSRQNCLASRDNAGRHKLTTGEIMAAGRSGEPEVKTMADGAVEQAMRMTAANDDCF